MPGTGIIDAVGSAALRARAQLRLNRSRGLDGPQPTAGAALSVLHALASSPSTAADALTLLHELQVHQVEVALQDEELRVSLVAAEQALERQMQLYEFAPVAHYSIDRNTTLLELNLAGAQLLGRDRDAVLGQSLARCLAPAGAADLCALLTKIVECRGTETLRTQLMSADGQPRDVQLSVAANPSLPQQFLVAVMPMIGANV